jgi:hypothetical protein
MSVDTIRTKINIDHFVIQPMIFGVSRLMFFFAILSCHPVLLTNASIPVLSSAEIIFLEKKEAKNQPKKKNNKAGNKGCLSKRDCMGSVNFWMSVKYWSNIFSGPLYVRFLTVNGQRGQRNHYDTPAFAGFADFIRRAKVLQAL